MEKFADLTPYLSGANVRKYPNLAAIPTGGWQSAAWEDKIYGFPCWTSGNSFTGVLYYRGDVFESKGITPARSACGRPVSLGAELTSKAAGVYAFDMLWISVQQIFKAPPNGPGDFVIRTARCSPASTPRSSSPRWSSPTSCQVRLRPPERGGRRHQRRQAALLVRQGARDVRRNRCLELSDATSGQGANPRYVRAAFDVFSTTAPPPTIALGNSSGMTSYLSKSLSKTQIEEILELANYLAAPFGSYEYTLINYGVEGTDYTMTSTGPSYTKQGDNESSEAIYQQFVTPQSADQNFGSRRDPGLLRLAGQRGQARVQADVLEHEHHRSLAVPDGVQHGRARRHREPGDLRPRPWATSRPRWRTGRSPAARRCSTGTPPTSTTSTATVPDI